MVICGIYKITSVTGCVYIGQSTNILGRWDSHIKYLGAGKTRLRNSIKSHGIENHTFEIIEECQQELLNEREIHWVQYYDSFDTPHGLNLTSGGYQGQHSEETKKKISEKLMGKKRAPFSEEAIKNMRKPKSEETRKKISITMKGVPKSEETRKNISKGQMGNKNGSVPKSEETKKKLRGNNYALGYIFTEEQRKNSSDAKKGNKNSLGYKYSPETIAKRLSTKAKNIELKKQLKHHIVQSIIFRCNIINNCSLYSLVCCKTNNKTL